MGLMGTAGTLSIRFVLPLMGSVYDNKKIEVAGGVDAFNRLQPGPELDNVLGIARAGVVPGRRGAPGDSADRVRRDLAV